MAPIVLYQHPLSPPSWTVRMLASIIGVELDIKNLDLTLMQHMSSDFLQLNPMGTIPTIQDGDFVISESHTIIKYLLEKYGSAHRERLYPSDIKARALVDQAMYYDTGVVFIRCKNIGYPALIQGAKAMGPELPAEFERTFASLNMYLEKHAYVAANHLTIADLCLGASVYGIQRFYPVDSKKYPKLAAWLSKLENEPFFKDIAVPGSAVLEDAVRTCWEKNSKK